MNSNDNRATVLGVASRQHRNCCTQQKTGVEAPEPEANRPCPICGEQNKEPLYQQHFSHMSSGTLHRGYEVVACRACGFCFADRIPSQEAFDDYYETMSKYERPDSAGQASSYDLGRFQSCVSFLQSFHRNLQARTLEIGCSTGGLLSLLQKAGYTNLLGVDPSPSCATAAAKQYGLRVITAKLSDIDLPDGSFDLIILAGVLEHVRDLDQALCQLQKLLTPRGQLYIVVPDASRYAEGEDAPFQEFSSEHINFFGPTSLSDLLARYGFSLLALQPDMVQGNYRTSTPVIHAAYQRQITGEARPVSGHDTETVRGLRKYISRSGEEDQRLHRIVEDIVEKGGPLVVWGTGSLTLRLLETSRLKEANLCAFVDSNPRYQGKTLHGIPIISPNSLSSISAPILISSRVYQKEIREQITQRLSLKNEVLTLYQLDEA